MENIPHVSSNEDEVSPSTKDEILYIGSPSLENIFERVGYVMSYDLERKVARWVQERLTSNHIVDSKLYCGNAKEFKEDTDISGVASLADYTYWGNYNYERGHLAAAANHKYNRKAYDNTFLISNIVPMDKMVNSVLNRIEEQARKFVKYHGTVHIVTGPIFRSERKEPIVVGNATVLVPNDIFKIIVYEENNRYKVWGYVVNSNVDDTNIYYSMRKLSEIKDLTGLNLLCNVPESNIDEMLSRHRHVGC